MIQLRGTNDWRLSRWDREAVCRLPGRVPDWLHKSFYPDNIILFGQRGTQGGFRGEWSAPYVNGFDSSRSEDAHSVPWNAVHSEFRPYIHPDRQGMQPSRFKKSYDMYSLGVVLLEIAYLESFRDQWVGASASSIQRTLLKKAVEVRVHFGRRYSEAIIACLGATMTDDLYDGDDFALLNEFRSSICEKLEEIVL
jgi:hypothetical protein